MSDTLKPAMVELKVLEPNAQVYEFTPGKVYVVNIPRPIPFKELRAMHQVMKARGVDVLFLNDCGPLTVMEFEAKAGTRLEAKAETVPCCNEGTPGCTSYHAPFSTTVCYDANGKRL